MQNKTKLHLGCGKRNFGTDWINVDGQNYEHVDVVSKNLCRLPFADEVFDLVYASHLIAYYDRYEIQWALKEWKRVLKPGGVLRLATPDATAMFTLYADGVISLESILGPLYGKMEMDGSCIYHKTVYDFNTLNQVLMEAGFVECFIYNWRTTEHAAFDDHSQAYLPHLEKENGKLISLNVECIKPKQ